MPTTPKAIAAPTASVDTSPDCVVEARPDVFFHDLKPEVQRELRRIWHELSAFPFVDRAWLSDEDRVNTSGGAGTGRGRRSKRGADKPFVDGCGGAAVYHDIQQGRGASRGEVEQAIERYVIGGMPSPIALRALVIAERRLGLLTDPLAAPLSAPALPPDAGDDPLPLEDPERLARLTATVARKRSSGARRAWVTMRTNGIRGEAKPKVVKDHTPERAASLRAAALAAWATRRAKAQKEAVAS